MLLIILVQSDTYHEDVALLQADGHILQDILEGLAERAYMRIKEPPAVEPHSMPIM